MKKFNFIIIIVSVFISCTNNHKTSLNNANEATEKKITLDETTETIYNKDLAKALGADDYGMRQYVMAFLKKGPNRDLDSTAAAALQAAHMDNISRLAEDNKLIVAGPFLDDGDIRGIYIFDVKTIEDAKILTESDPAIKAGSLVMELHPWYGSAALMQVNEVHQTLKSKSF